MITIKNSSEIVETGAWRDYRSGLEYDRITGYSDTAARNERFWLGDQWRGSAQNGLQTPVFNIIQRIVTYLVASVASHDTAIVYSADDLPFSPDGAASDRIRRAIWLLNRNSAHRWEKCRMDALVRDVLLDAAISGDGVFYTYWDGSIRCGRGYRGDIKTTALDSTSLFVADTANTDIQSQRWILLAGRAEVQTLVEEAKRAGLGREELAKIVPDRPEAFSSASLRPYSETDGDKATYLIRFSRDKNGFVKWEKCVRSAVIRSGETHMRMYPVAVLPWLKTRGSYRGSSPVTPLVENQIFVNRAYAMVMKHMSDTAFSKVIYDKKLIPDWSNEVGQAIGVTSCGDVSGAVKVVGCGEMQDDYLALIESVIKNTKETAGATEVALGEWNASNTSAIVALKSASEQPQEAVRRRLYDAVEQVALIWAEFMCEYYTDGRMVSYDGEGGEEKGDAFDFSVMRDELISAKVEVGAANSFSQLAVLSQLEKLLEGGRITLVQYLRHLPDGIFADRDGLIRELEDAENGKKPRETDEPAVNT